MRKLLPIILTVLMLSGCMGANVPELEDENISAAPAALQTPVPQPTAQPDETATGEQTPAATSPQQKISLQEKMALLSFAPVSGNYARKCMQEEMEFTEMFVAGKSSFVRMAASDDEEEVFVYNYGTDEFTYLYYFSGELASKAVYDIGGDKVIEDKDGLMEVLKSDAVELKDYYLALIEEANVTTQELMDGGF